MQKFIRATRVESLTTVRRERVLPADGDVVARIGQNVTPVQVVARMPGEKELRIISVSDLLKVPPREVSKYLLVQEGQTIAAGTPLVKKRGLFGKSFVSPVDGVIYRAGNGRLVLQRTADWIELRAMTTGRVINQLTNRGVVLEIDGSVIQALWSSGKEGFGKTKVISSTADEAFEPSLLNDGTSDQVLVLGHVANAAELEMIESNFARGLIVGSLSVEARLAASKLPYPILVTDGIGEQGMAEPIFELLRQSDGFEATLFGLHDERGVQRPEIIIPSTAMPGSDASSADLSLTVGQNVRILRPPYQSQIGEVAKLYAHTRTTNIGTKAHGADVKLSDGQMVFVPFENLDAIIT